MMKPFAYVGKEESPVARGVAQALQFRITIGFDAAAWRKIQTLAEENSLSASAQIRVLVNQALRKNK